METININQYEKTLHKINETYFVYGASGNLYEIKKDIGSTYSSTLDKKPIYIISRAVKRRTKKATIKFLLNN